PHPDLHSFPTRRSSDLAGYHRQLTEFPVEYPTACSPQAWASGTPLLLLRAIFGMEPIGDNLLVDPAIPSMLGQLELLDIPGRWGDRKSTRLNSSHRTIS